MQWFARYFAKFGVEMRSDMLPPGHAWNPCDGDKGIHTKVFTSDQIEQGRGFDLVEDWLMSAAGAGFENHRYYGHDADVIEDWVSNNKLQYRDQKTWRFRDLRSFVYHRETDEGTNYTPGIAYGAVHSDVEFADRILLDLRHDKEAGGPRCEKCTQRFKRPTPAHKKGQEGKCPSKHQRLGEPALAVHVRSGLTDGMDYEEKQAYFNKLASGRAIKKTKAKGRFAGMLKQECVRLLKMLGLSTEGNVPELRQRLQMAVDGGAELRCEPDGGDSAVRRKVSSKEGSKKGAKKAAQKAAHKRDRMDEELNMPGSRPRKQPSKERVAPESRPKRKAAQVETYSELDRESEQEASEGSDWQADCEEWECEACNHPNFGPPPNTSDFEGCELCGWPEPGSKEGEESESSW